MMTTPFTHLIHRAQQGDGGAISELYEQYRVGVFRYLYYRTSDPQVAEDLTSEVFIRMIRSLVDYRPNQQHLSSLVNPDRSQPRSGSLQKEKQSNSKPHHPGGELGYRGSTIRRISRKNIERHHTATSIISESMKINGMLLC
jgi:hypothetical protein